MTIKPLAAAIALAYLAVLPTAASADELLPQLKISGYGTVAGVVTDDSTAGFRRESSLSAGVGKHPDIGTDSRFGLQGNLDFQSGFSAVGQIVAKRRSTGSIGNDKDFDPQVEWLYGQYQFLPSTNVRLGRMALPTFLLSDSLNVGYTAPWLRAPVHVYSSNPMSRLDGVQLNWRESLAGVNLGAQAGYGKTKAFLYSTIGGAAAITPLEADKVVNVNLTAESGNWLGRFGVSRASVLRPSGPTLDDTYKGIGLQYDNGTALVMAEVAQRSQNKLPAFQNHDLARGRYAYVSGGWRFGKLLPMLTFSQNYRSLYSGPVAPRAHTLAHSVGASLRYDVATNLALKAQLDRFPAYDPAAFVHPRAGDDTKVNVYSAGIDFVF